MNREELSHLLRAATTITNDPDILVIGSQAILGTYDDENLPAAMRTIWSCQSYMPGVRKTGILHQPYFRQA